MRHPILSKVQSDIELRNYSEATRDIYLRACARYLGFLGDKPIEETDESDVRAFSLHLSHARGLVPATVNTNLAAVLFMYTRTSKPTPDPDPEPDPDLHPYTITYKLNGGNYDGKTDDVLETHYAGEVITIRDKPTREGYTFLYWKGSEYYPGDSYTVVGDHTFVAQWEKDDNPTTPTTPTNPTKPTTPTTRTTTTTSTRSPLPDTSDHSLFGWLFGLLSG